MAPAAIILKRDIKTKRKTRYQESDSTINTERKPKAEVNTQT